MSTDADLGIQVPVTITRGAERSKLITYLETPFGGSQSPKDISSSKINWVIREGKTVGETIVQNFTISDASVSLYTDGTDGIFRISFLNTWTELLDPAIEYWHSVFVDLVQVIRPSPILVHERQAPTIPIP